MIRLVDVYPPSQAIIEFLYQLLLERPAEANISHAEMPTMEKHRQFVHRRPYREWFVVEAVEGHRVGAIYLTDRNEVGIAIAKEHQRLGYGRAAIEEIRRTVLPLPAEASVRRGTYIAHVAPANYISKALFEGLGAKQIMNTYEL